MIPSSVQNKLLEIKNALDRLVSLARTVDDEDQREDILNKILFLKKEYRVLRGEYDVLYFTYQYFSDVYNPENEDNLIPSDYSLENAPSFHKELCGILDEFHDSPTNRICWAAPRGHAKSAYLSNTFPVHQVVYKKRRYILIISETERMSQRFVEWVGNQLKFNKKLREDFGEFLSPNSRINDSDNIEGFVTMGGFTKVQAASIGKQLRGARHGSSRPDLLVLDDLESAKNTNTKELRDKNFHWYNSVVNPIGDPKRTGFIYMGTLVHGQGLLPAVLQRSDYRGRIYSAILSDPTHPELWEKAEEILRNVENPNREDEVMSFYYDNKDMMDSGVQTLWPDRFSYLDLIKIKVNVGSRAFSSEYLNKPSDSETCIFREDMFQYFDDRELFDASGRRINLDIYGFWDIAVGRNDRADYNAIVIIGRDKRTGVMYILDAWAAKVPAHKALEVAEQKIKQFRPKIFGVETIQMQYEMYRQLRERLVKAGIYHTRLLSMKPTAKKEDRIENIEPLVEGGYIRFKKSHRLLLEQMVQFPNGDHDDLPDALASAIEIAGRQRKRAYHKKPTGI